jgi:hypothetical protein
MSEIYLRGIDRWGNSYCPVLESYEGAGGGAITIWNFMAQRFAGVESHFFMDETTLFRLAYQKKIPEHFRRVMLLTYDKAVLLNSNVDQAIKDINLVLNEYAFPTNKMNHWIQIAEDLKNYSHSKKYIGFGFNMYVGGDNFFEGELYKKRHLEKRKKIEWKANGYFSVYHHNIDRY